MAKKRLKLKTKKREWVIKTNPKYNGWPGDPIATVEHCRNNIQYAVKVATELDAPAAIVMKLVLGDFHIWTGDTIHDTRIYIPR